MAINSKLGPTFYNETRLALASKLGPAFYNEVNHLISTLAATAEKQTEPTFRLAAVCDSPEYKNKQTNTTRHDRLEKRGNKRFRRSMGVGMGEWGSLGDPFSVRTRLTIGFFKCVPLH